ncbi:MAG: DMT family transporter [Armatimonadota bacterium]
MRAADIGALLLVNFIWGSTYVAGKGVLDTAPPLVLAFLRFFLSVLCLFCLGAYRMPKNEDGERGSVRQELRNTVLLGVVGFALAKLLHYEGLARSTATDAALLVNLEAIFTALLAALWLGQRLGAPQWAGVLLAFSGGLLLVWPGDGFHFGRSVGNLILIASVLAEAVATVLGARAMQRLSGLQVTAFGSVWGMLCLAPLAWWQWRADGFSTAWLTWGNAAATLYLALVATVFAYVLWFRVLGRVEAGRAAVFLYAQPLVGVLLAVLLRGEWPTLLGLAGGLLVLAGLHLASREAPDPAAAPG